MIILKRAFSGVLAAGLVFLLVLFAPAYLAVIGELFSLLARLIGVISNSSPNLTLLITFGIALVVGLKTFFKI